MSSANSFIKPSKIHGLGLFAKRDIIKGDRIIQGLADFSYDKEWVPYVKKFKTKSFCYNNGYCMLNHSTEPNTKRGPEPELGIIASRDICNGEEITEDYYKLSPDHNPFTSLNIEELVFQAKPYRKNKFV